MVIAATFSITRNVAWKMIKQLEDNNIGTETQNSTGYRLKKPLFLLERKKILAALPKKLQSDIELEIYSQLSSTNTYFLENGDRDYSKPVFCVAELQTAGKGRMGRQWHSPFAENIYCSFRYDVPCNVSKLSGLSLVIGLAVIDALQQYDSSLALSLKWPNDILAEGKKLGGILIELQAEAHGGCSVIVGLGLNCNMLDDHAAIERDWHSLQQLLCKPVNRNDVLALLIPSLLTFFQQFIASGFAHFKTQWKQFDYLAGKHVTMTHRNKKVKGVVLGVDQFGQLRLQKPDKTVISCAAGEATLR